MDDVIIVGGGIGGLTLALMLHERGIPSRVYEAASEIRPIGVGISLLPHATQELGLLGLTDALSAVAITTKESCFFNRSAGTPATTGPSSRYTEAICSRCSTGPTCPGPAPETDVCSPATAAPASNPTPTAPSPASSIPSQAATSRRREAPR